MDSLQAASSILGVFDIATRTVIQLRKISESWSSAPYGVYQLRDTIDAFRQLLDHTLKVKGYIATKTISHGESLDALNKELIVAKKSLGQLTTILDHVRGLPTPNASDGLPLVAIQPSHPATDVPSSHASMKTRWLMQREKTARLQAELKESHDRVLARLLILNLSLTVDVDSSLQQQRLATASIGSHVSQGLQLAGTIEQRTREIPVGLDRVTGQINSSRQNIISQLDQIPAATATQVVAPLAYEINRNLDMRLEAFSQDLEARMQQRNVHNEQLFNHFERRFSTITGMSNSRGTYALPFPLSTRPTNRTCTSTCACKCHTQPRGDVASTIWTLSAFESTLGSLRLLFKGRLMVSCVPSCKSRRSRSRRFQVVYTCPSWLFHASVALSFTDSNGPELVMRILNRVPPDLCTMASGFFSYIRRGDIYNVKRVLCSREASVFDVSDLNGVSVLTSALLTDSIELVPLLLHEGADPLQTDDYGVAAIEHAVEMVYASSYLSASSRNALEDAFPVNLMVESCCLTNLHKVIMGITHLEIVEYLSLTSNYEINLGDIHNRTPLFFASAKGDMRTVQALLNAGALPNIASSSASGTPLHIACRNRHFDVVRILIGAGADIHARTRSGVTPLLSATFRRLSNLDRVKEVTDIIRIIGELLRHGADVNAVSGLTLSAALDFASLYNFAPLVNFLLNEGADINHRDFEGSTALDEAIVWDARDSAKILLRRGGDYRSIDGNGQGTLHLLAMAASAEMMQDFIDINMFGLDVARQDKDGHTPTQLLHRRDGLTAHIIETFERLLESVSSERSFPDEDGDSEAGEFFDALEH